MWNAFQVAFIYTVFPETSGRTLEELTFCELANIVLEMCLNLLMDTSTVYDDEQEVETLREREETVAYGTMEDTSRRTIGSGGEEVL